MNCFDADSESDSGFRFGYDRRCFCDRVDFCPFQGSEDRSLTDTSTPNDLNSHFKSEVKKKTFTSGENKRNLSPELLRENNIGHVCF